MNSRSKNLLRTTQLHAKVRIGQFLSSPVFGVLISFACRNLIRNRGVIIDTSSPEFTAAVKAKLAFGIYESAEIRFIRKYLTGYSRVLELGAGLGVTATHILDVMGPGAEVVCVEANPNLLTALHTTTAIAAERTGGTVKTIHGAVPLESRVRSPAVVFTLGSSHLESRVGSADVENPERQLNVPVVDLAEVVRGWTDYALVCDIEGAEASLILPAQSVLTCASRVIIELHETEHEGTVVAAIDLREALLNMGFLFLEERGNVLVLAGPAVASAGE